jgi:hypothetical protein
MVKEYLTELEPGFHNITLLFGPLAVAAAKMEEPRSDN